jgi:hypothetical protein
LLQEDETEANNDVTSKDKAGGDVKKEVKVAFDVITKEPVTDIEDTVTDVEMRNRKLEALDKIKYLNTISSIFTPLVTPPPLPHIHTHKIILRKSYLHF